MNKMNSKKMDTKKRTLTIVVHVAVWSFLIYFLNTETLNLEWGAFVREQGSILIPLIYGSALGAGVFYLNVYRLIPRFFGKGNKMQYWKKAASLFFIVTLFETLIDVTYLIISSYELAKEQFQTEPTSAFVNWVIMLFVINLTANLFCWIIAFAYRLPQDWLNAEKQKNQLEQDKLRSELNFLKAQINPHFLFNGINSIYHMIGNDDEAARETLLEFSGLLRYQLYECNEKYISLDKELEYVSNYLNIEEVRKGEDANFTFELPDSSVEDQLKKYKIAPLLISPFLENAFKYLSHHSNRKHNFASFKLEISKEGILKMSLENSHEPSMKTNYPKAGGIGLENVKRRLSLLYPEEKHHLNIRKSSTIYHVELMINLNEN